MAQQRKIGDSDKSISAVEWFAKELIDEGFYIPKGIYDRAKQMEKEQSKQDYDAGLFDGTMDDVKDRLYKNAEQYYNETYNK